MFFPKVQLLTLLLGCFFIVLAEASNSESTCDLRELDAKVSDLEKHLLQQLEALRNEIKGSARFIEHQTKATRAAAENCRNDFRRVLERTRRYSTIQTHDPQLEQKVNDIFQGTHLSLASLRLLNWDVAAIKRNLTDILNTTNAFLQKLDVSLNLNKVFNDDDPESSAHPPRNCMDVKKRNADAKSGIYTVEPENAKKSFMVFCDLETENGGWLKIQNRYEGSQDFYLGWQDYKLGFGNVAGEYWLGLENIYQLTSNQVNELLIELVDVNKVKTVAHYLYFSVGSEEEGYPLKVLTGYQGNAGDSLTYHAGSKFSTKDKDQDSWTEGNCAQSHSGGWWYKSCDKSNLNGKYLPGELPDQLLYQGMYWGEFGGPQVGLLEAKMMIRPHQENNSVILPKPS